VKFTTLTNHTVTDNIYKKTIDWDAPCRSKFQFRVSQFFRQFWSGDICCAEWKIPRKRLFVDLINFTKKIAVEISGEQHRSFKKAEFFHKNRMNFLRSLKRDSHKQDFLELNNFNLIVIFPEDEKKLSLEWIRDEFSVDI